MNELVKNSVLSKTITKRDDGIRPAGGKDKCCYCLQKVGVEHADDCVIPQKIVRVEVSFEIEIPQPTDSTKEMIEFHYNEGSWCADNAIDWIQTYAKTLGCACPFFELKFLEVTDMGPYTKQRDDEISLPE